MTQKTKHICRCGQVALSQNEATEEWLCLGCAIQDMCADLRRGEHVTVSFSHRGISDVILAPMDDGKVDLFAPLVDVVPISFCRN